MLEVEIVDQICEFLAASAPNTYLFPRWWLHLSGLLVNYLVVLIGFAPEFRLLLGKELVDNIVEVSCLH